MHVQFEFTLEDMIDTSKRFLARSEVVRAWRLKSLLYAAVFTWGAVFLCFLFIVKSPLKGAIIGLLAAVIIGFLYPRFDRSGVESRLRELHREAYGEADTYICEVELTPNGILVKQMNTETSHEWESVEEIKETTDSVDIFCRNGGVVVRDRAFVTVEERREFIELAESYVELSRSSDSKHNRQFTNGGS
jgi:hypothetical protein